jgi:hypothetical protein
MTLVAGRLSFLAGYNTDKMATLLREDRQNYLSLDSSDT